MQALDRTESVATPTLNIAEKQPVSYCIPLWLRDEQIRSAIARVKGRLELHRGLREERIAIVGYGPSLADTWELLKDFSVIITCSGAHKFLIERGIIPTYHIDVDPRAHKADLIGTPHPDVQYLMASTCHPKVFDLLEGYNVKLWHIFDSAEEGFRILPQGEWALTGGAGAGLRAMVIARALGYVDQHVFGLDGSDGPTGKHAGAHPAQAKKRFAVEHDGQTYYTTPAFLECAKAVFHELDAMPDVTATFYGEGLVQAMARTYVRTAKAVQPNVAFSKPELISDELRTLNARLHRDNLTYGVGGGKHAETVLKMAAAAKTTSILDYGCGKGYLAKAIPFPIWEYDPAIPEKSTSPRPADIVVCTDVLEHVEEGKVQFVLGDIRRCLLKTGYFVIHMGPAVKTYADGRNTHLTQRSQTWWEAKLAKFFDVAKTWRNGPQLHAIVGPSKVHGLAASARKEELVSLPPPAFKFDALGTTSVWFGGLTEALDPRLYNALARSFPSATLFKSVMGGGNKKLTLSEGTNGKLYAQHIAQYQAWREFHAYIKGAFVNDACVMAREKFLRDDLRPEELSARFEFSRLPSNGGQLLPHTDLPDKVMTIVLSMRRDGDGWEDAWGGGTLILAPKDFDQELPGDYKAPLSAFDVGVEMPYAVNAAAIFFRSSMSWHAVGPLTGPGDGRMRRTITINVERKKA